MTDATPEETSQVDTPIYDDVKNDVQANPGDVETADSVKVDIKRALERETQDGKGDEDLGPSDFQGFATEGVEKEDSQ